MTAIIDGFLKQGIIILLEVPRGLQEGRARVMVHGQEPSSPPPAFLKFGKYQTGRMSILEDFKDAEWINNQG